MAVTPHNSSQGPLVPRFSVHHDTRDPINRPKFKRNNTKWIPLGVFFLFSFIAIPLTLNQLNNRQDLRQRAAGPFPTQVIPSPTPFPTETPTATQSVTISPTISSATRTASPASSLNSN